MIISFNSELYFFSLILRYFILIFMLKISIFRLYITILYYFSFFLILLTSNICSYISLCFSRAFAIYFFEIIRTILLSLYVLVIVTTIMSDFVFFNALFTALRIFIACKIQFSFFKVTINLLSWYDISCDFDESFLMTRFHSLAFAFTFVLMFAFADWVVFYAYVNFNANLCFICLSCVICESIENMLHTLHATYIRHDLYADFFLSEK